MSSVNGRPERFGDLHIPEGTPVYDSHGAKVGEVSKHGIEGGYLVIHRGRLFPHPVSIPAESIREIGADGVRLAIAEQQVHDIALGGWSNLGEVDLTTGVPARTDIGMTPNFPDGNNVAGTRTATDLPTGLPHSPSEPER